MYFAELDKNKKVLRVIVADQAFIDSGKVGNPKNWVETKEENYAGIGYTFNNSIKKFTSPLPETIVLTKEERDNYLTILQWQQ